MIKQYPMRVDEQLWRQAKARAALEGITLRETIEKLLEAWISGKLKIDKR